MASLTVNVQGHVHGRWRLRLAAWLISGLRVYYRIGKGKRQRLPLSVEIVVSPNTSSANVSGANEALVQESVEALRHVQSSKMDSTKGGS